MKRSGPDVRIDAWLRDELDAVPEPTRALSRALDAAMVTPQRRGRLFWLRQLLGSEQTTVTHGRLDRPEIVLTPGSPSSGVMHRQGAASTSVVMVVLLVAVTVVGAMAWLTVGPGRELLGGGPQEAATISEQPMRPLDPPGPDRVIVVHPEDGHFATIAGAVAAAQTGDRIEVYPGTYQAEVTITEDVTVAGVGDRESIVIESADVAPGEDERDRLHDVFTLRDSDAILQGFTVRGSLNGTAIAIDGGSPQLLDLFIDPLGEMDFGSPTTPRESIEFSSGSTAIVRDTVMTSLSSVIDGAAPLMERVTFEGGCLLIEGIGTAPTITDASYHQSECPGFSVSVAKGASATLVANHVYSSPDQAGVRVANDGSRVVISGSDITGGREGILVTSGAEVEVQRSQVDEAEVGVRVLDADASLLLNRFERNGTGLRVSGDTYLETIDNDICDNDLNLDLHDGALVPLAQNRVCVDGSSELAVEGGA